MGPSQSLFVMTFIVSHTTSQVSSSSGFISWLVGYSVILGPILGRCPNLNSLILRSNSYSHLYLVTIQLYSTLKPINHRGDYG